MNAAKKIPAPLNIGIKIPAIIAKASSPPESEIDLHHIKFIMLNITCPIMMLPAEDSIHWKTDGGSDEVFERCTRRYWVAMNKRSIGKMMTKGFQWTHISMGNMLKSASNKFLNANTSRSFNPNPNE